MCLAKLFYRNILGIELSVFFVEMIAHAVCETEERTAQVSESSSELWALWSVESLSPIGCNLSGSELGLYRGPFCPQEGSSVHAKMINVAKPSARMIKKP